MKKKVFAKTKAQVFLFGMLAAALAFGAMLAGCDTGGGGGDGDSDPGKRAFSVSGSFTKSGTGSDGQVNFNLQSDGAALSAGRAVTADSYTVSGVLEDGDFTIRLKGSYNPNNGTWSASAKSDTIGILYSLEGVVNSAGVSQASTATIAVKNSGTGEWDPYVFSITESAAVAINGTAVDGDGGMPSWAQGWWHIEQTHGDGSTQSMDGIVSDWTMKMSGTRTFLDGTVIPIEQNMTLVELTDLGNNVYEYIGCQAVYAETKETLIKAVAAALGLNASDIKEVGTKPEFNSYEEWLAFGRWCWFFPGDENLRADWGLRSEEEYEKLELFWRTNGWAKWAVRNPSEVSRRTAYNKVKVTYTGSNRMDVITMVKVPDESKPWNYNGDFSTLEEAKAATVEKHEWHDDGNGGKTMGDLNVMTITR